MLENSEPNTNMSDSRSRKIALTAPWRRDQEVEQLGVHNDSSGKKIHKGLDYNHRSKDHENL